jgi:hypothetical protein
LNKISLACMITIVLISPSFAASLSMGQTVTPTSPTLPPGFPSFSTLSSVGNSLVSVITKSVQFRAISHGQEYHIEPYSSFGYSWGPGIPSTERVILFSADGSTSIVSEVSIATKQVQSISLINDTQTRAFYSTQLSYADYSGYSAQFWQCQYIIFSCSTTSILGVYGNIQIPSTISSPTGATAACCQFAEWTGVSSTASGNNLVQGGIAWTGDNQGSLPQSNSEGFSLFTEYVPSGSNTGTGPQFFPPPSWMDGVQGQTILMTTKPDANCSSKGVQSGNVVWVQFWQDGSMSTAQSIQCLSPSTENYGWYIFETPNQSSCTSGGFRGYCEIPKFSTISFTGNICNQATCRNINSNSDPIQGYYIGHNSVDTATSSIPSGGNSWTETWLSSK